MMECFQVVLLFILLVPIPTASPVFVALYLIAVFFVVSPCGSCIGWCAILYVATSPSSPFISSSPPHLPINPEYPLTSPTEERKWLSWNNGRIWDPTLAGYAQFVDPAVNTSETVVQLDAPSPAPAEGSGGQRGLLRLAWNLGKRTVGNAIQGVIRRDAVAPTSAVQDRPAETVAMPEAGPEAAAHDLPKQYLDFRWSGLGLVLDFGWKRSEEGMRWELEEYRRGAPASRSTSLPSNAHPPQSPEKGSWIGRMPLLGNW